MITDAINGGGLITDGHTIWGTVSLVLICLPVAIVGLVLLLALLFWLLEWIFDARSWSACCSITGGEEEQEGEKESTKVEENEEDSSSESEINTLEKIATSLERSAVAMAIKRLAERNSDMGRLCRLIFSVFGLCIIVALYNPAVILITTLYIIFVILCGVKRFYNPESDWEAEFESGGWGGIFSPEVAMILMVVEVCMESGPQSSVGKNFELMANWWIYVILYIDIQASTSFW